jgi:hypothetical protein
MPDRFLVGGDRIEIAHVFSVRLATRFTAGSTPRSCRVARRPSECACRRIRELANSLCNACTALCNACTSSPGRMGLQRLVANCAAALREALANS